LVFGYIVKEVVVENEESDWTGWVGCEGGRGTLNLFQICKHNEKDNLAEIFKIYKL